MSYPPWPGFYGPPAASAHPHVYMPAYQPWIRANHGYWEQVNPQGAPAGASSLRSPSAPTLNPILAADTTHLSYDVRHTPSSSIIASIYHSNRSSPISLHHPKFLRLISKDFPWMINIESPQGEQGWPLTVEAVWEALHGCMQEKIEDSEWGMVLVSGNKKWKEMIEKAYKKRIEGGDKEKKMKRIDFLGDATFFKGFEKDEEFEKARKLKGEKDDKVKREVWTVKMGP